MSNSRYIINKGIGRPLEFRGLQAQYILYLAAGLVILLIVFVTLYIAGIPSYVCVGIVGLAGFILFYRVYRLSKQYGQYGILKKKAARRVPPLLVSRSRKVFMREN